MSLAEEVIRTVTKRPFEVGLVSWVVLSISILGYLGIGPWLLFVGFCLLVLALSLLWMSITSLGEEQKITLEEALDLAAPARDEERKVSVLRGLKDLDYEHSLGKISDEDYRALTLRYRGEARQLLERLDTSEASLRQRVLEAVSKRLDKSS